jgi:hypothetical protein
MVQNGEVPSRDFANIMQMYVFLFGLDRVTFYVFVRFVRSLIGFSMVQVHAYS